MGVDSSVLGTLGKFLHLQHFPQEALERLAAVSGFKKYSKNDIIYRPRTEKHGAVFIVSGLIVGSIQDILSDDERMMVFFPGTPISTDLYAQPRVFETTIRAFTNVRCIYTPKAALIKWCEEVENGQALLWKVLSLSFVISLRFGSLNSGREAKERIVLFFAEYLRNSSCLNDYHGPYEWLPTHAELSTILGISRSYLTNTLNDLEKDGHLILDRSSKQLIIPDGSPLKEYEEKYVGAPERRWK